MTTIQSKIEYHNQTPNQGIERLAYAGGIATLGVTCGLFAECFSQVTSPLRLSLEVLALVGCGLFVSQLILSNRRLNLEAETRLRVVVETNPAAIVTVDEFGFIDLSNRAAEQLMAPRAGGLCGHPIAAYFPQLYHAIRRKGECRASLRCCGLRGDGERFCAEVWFSTFDEKGRRKFAAIIFETGESTRAEFDSPRISIFEPVVFSERDLQILRLLVEGLSNKEMASRMRVSESSVKNTFQQLFAKTGVRTRSDLVRVTLEGYRSLL
jgi:PAS domain S-box-containing protein